MAWCELREMMRNWSWLLISVAGIAAAEPPPRVELVFTLTRNGSVMAEVTEQLQYAGGNYQLTETGTGKGFYALLGSARRVSQGEDRETAELWLAAERNYIPVRLLVVERDGTRYEQNATRISP